MAANADDSAFQSTLDAIDIQANAIEYLPEQALLLASGNVIVTYQKYCIRSESLRINYQERSFAIPGTYNIIYNNDLISGKNLQFDFDDTFGKTEDISIAFDRTRIRGEKLTITTRNVTVEEGFFTTCPQRNPEYTFRAERIVIYPAIGLVVLNNTTFSLFGVPVLFVPTYIVGNPLYSTLLSQTPLPEFGANETEGAFVRGRVGYFINEKNVGTVDLGYLTKRGIQIGFTHQFLYSESVNNFLELHYYTGEKDPNKIEAAYLLEKALYFDDDDGKGKREETNDPIEQYRRQQKVAREEPPYLLYLEAAHKKLINFQYVSFLPRIQVESTDKGFRDWFYYAWQVSVARVSENDKPIDVKTDIFGNIYKPMPVETLGTFIPGISYSSVYTRYEPWRQVIGYINYENDFYYDTWEFAIGYYHLLLQEGELSYAFEQFDEFETNYVDIKLAGNLKHSDLLLRYKYDTVNHKHLDLEAVYAYKADCMRIGLGYRFLRKEVQLQFTIF